MKGKKDLMKNLQNDVYVRLKPSINKGVGVFAIKNIPAGVDPFKVPRTTKHNLVAVNEDEIKRLDKNVQKLVYDFYQPYKGVYHIPMNGPNANDISFYLNHSVKKANLDVVEGNEELLSFVTSRIIEKGEELLINYNDYNEY